MRVQHFDRISIRWDESTLRTNADQSRTIDGFGAHVGPYTYHDDKGQPFVELVPASTLFEPASLDSAAGSTLTIRHGPGLVTPDRYRQESHGAWVKAWDAGDGNLGVRLRLGSSEALAFVDEAIAKGVSVELSPVYEVDVLDTPGTTEDGHHDAVQDKRRYSGIALLGPDEARGGPRTKLKLDGPECAPEGSRVEVSRPRLDSAPLAPLHSATGRSNTMKHATIKSGGKQRAISLDALTHIRALTHGDQIETGRVTIEIEGEETSELVLPTSMIEMLLEGIGASPAAAAPEDVSAEVEVEQVESVDADDDEKMDAKTIKVAVAAEVKRQMDARDAVASRRASVNSDAIRCLPDSYSFEGKWQQWALDSVARKSPADEAKAKALFARSVNGDAEATGMLRMLLERVAATVPASSGGVKLAPGPKVDANDEAPWNADTMPARKDS